MSTAGDGRTVQIKVLENEKATEKKRNDKNTKKNVRSLNLFAFAVNRVLGMSFN